MCGGQGGSVHSPPFGLGGTVYRHPTAAQPCPPAFPGRGRAGAGAARSPGGPATHQLSLGAGHAASLTRRLTARGGGARGKTRADGRRREGGVSGGGTGSEWLAGGEEPSVRHLLRGPRTTQTREAGGSRSSSNCGGWDHRAGAHGLIHVHVCTHMCTHAHTYPVRTHGHMCTHTCVCVPQRAHAHTYPVHACTCTYA